jgi:uncharacterized protein YdeI (YjbR/CyaY-like superfamily)
MPDPVQYPTLGFVTQHDWEEWLAMHHAETPGLWLKSAKKGSGIASITYAEALEGALCYGWIDGQKAALDDMWWLQKFTPRRAKSGWSKVNREKAEALIAAERMHPAGLRQVELARADGRWDAAYDSQSRSEVPDDLQAALEASPEAQTFFATLESANRYAILYRLQTAKTPQTRAKRLQTILGMLERHEKFHP